VVGAAAVADVAVVAVVAAIASTAGATTTKAFRIPNSRLSATSVAGSRFVQSPGG